MGWSLYSVFEDIQDQSLSWKIFDEALDKVQDSEIVQQVLGIPIKGYAQDSDDKRIRNSLGYVIDTIAHVQACASTRKQGEAIVYAIPCGRTEKKGNRHG